MSETQAQAESNYRISLTDITGVGPATVEKLESIGVSNVEELHLCRKERYRTMARRAKERGNTIGSDTWEHIAAVGSAVHYSGSDRVKAKHLTCSLANGKDHYQFVDISTQESEESEESETREIPQYSTEQLQTALDSIHGEYPEGYGNQVSFEADLGRFLYEREGYDENDDMPRQGIIQSVIRYRHKADRVESQGDFTKCHKAVLVEFAETI